MDSKGTIWCRNIAENFNLLSRVHERYRRQTDRQTDDRRTDDDGRHIYIYSEFTFAERCELFIETQCGSTAIETMEYCQEYFVLLYQCIMGRACIEISFQLRAFLSVK